MSGGAASYACYKDFAKAIYDALGPDCTNIASATQARFINMYDPKLDRPLRSYTANADRYLDEELCKLLDEDRRNGLRNHITTDKVVKEYLLAQNTHNVIMRSAS